MKKNVHPKWYSDAVVTCACGNSFTVGSTVPEMRVEICAKCHPFYTGQMKYIDTMGRVEKFSKKQKSAKLIKAKLEKKKEKEKEKEKERQPKSLREMLQAIK